MQSCVGRDCGDVLGVAAVIASIAVLVLSVAWAIKIVRPTTKPAKALKQVGDNEVRYFDTRLKELRQQRFGRLMNDNRKGGQ